MEGKTALLNYLKQEIERRQITFTKEDRMEIDLENTKFVIA